jgi:hypothetical protein
LQKLTATATDEVGVFADWGKSCANLFSFAIRAFRFVNKILESFLVQFEFLTSHSCKIPFHSKLCSLLLQENKGGCNIGFSSQTALLIAGLWHIAIAALLEPQKNQRRYGRHLN